MARSGAVRAKTLSIAASQAPRALCAISVETRSSVIPPGVVTPRTISSSGSAACSSTSALPRNVCATKFCAVLGAGRGRCTNPPDAASKTSKPLTWPQKRQLSRKALGFEIREPDPDATKSAAMPDQAETTATALPERHWQTPASSHKTLPLGHRRRARAQSAFPPWSTAPIGRGETPSRAKFPILRQQASRPEPCLSDRQPPDCWRRFSRRSLPQGPQPAPRRAAIPRTGRAALRAADQVFRQRPNPQNANFCHGISSSTKPMAWAVAVISACVWTREDKECSVAEGFM